MRDDFDSKTKETLAKRVGFRCSNPNCRKLTSGPQEDAAKSINIGVAAHICAASEGVLDILKSNLLTSANQLRMLFGYVKIVQN